jgi:preprotein translocase subunit SecA
MAGRGTDIVLGGNWQAEVASLKEPTQEQIDHVRAEWQKRHDAVVAAGGLHIIGTERHESRRIDNQLRGRAGRQGDNGSSRFYLSMEDNLMRIFASDRIRGIMQSLGLEEGEAIEHRMVTNAIEKAQRKVEGRNFDIRKNLLEYDDVSNDQRQVIYQQRDELMAADEIADMIRGLREEIVSNVISEYIPAQSLEEQWDIAGLEQALLTEFNSTQPLRRWLDEDDALNEDSLRRRIHEQITAEYDAKEEQWRQQGVEIRLVEKQVMLQILDQRWKEHLATMDHLRQGIHLRAYAQKQPKQEYKREAFELFQELLYVIKRDAIRLLSRVQIERPETVEETERRAAKSRRSACASPTRTLRLLRMATVTAKPRNPSCRRRRRSFAMNAKWAATNHARAVPERNTSTATDGPADGGQSAAARQARLDSRYSDRHCQCRYQANAARRPRGHVVGRRQPSGRRVHSEFVQSGASSGM